MTTQHAPRRTGIVIGGIALLVVIVFVLTGFVAPGFLLSDDAEDGPGENARAAAGRFLTALRADDPGALRAMVCDDATEAVRDNVESIASVGIAEELPVRMDGAAAVLPLELELAGGVNRVYEFVLASRVTTWCWHDLRPEGAKNSDGAAPNPEPPTPTTETRETEVTTDQPTPAPENTADGEQVMTEFVDALNTGEQEAAVSLGCTAMDVEKDVAALTSRDVDLKITTTSAVSGISLNGDLTGTIDNTTATGTINAINLNNSWCISTLTLF